MTCSNETNLFVNNTLIDDFGGEIQLIDVAADLQSMYVNIITPWGSDHSYIEIDKGSSKTYTSGEKTYSIYMTDAGYINDKYIARIYVCYEFTEYLNTTITMIYDSSSSQLVEGGKIYFNLSLKDENNTELPYNVDIFINNIFERQVDSDHAYTHTITEDELGQSLMFQAKFNTLGIYNASQSTTTTIDIPGKSETNLSINVDKTDIVLGETVSFTGTLKNDDNNIIPNQTVSLVYKGNDGQYGYVLDNDGYKLIASTDSNGNYYRPWEPTETYLVYDTYAMYFAGNDNYNSTYSPTVTISINIDECIQNIKIQDQNYNPVEGVKITIDDVVQTTNVSGLVSFTLIKDKEYTVYKVYDTYTGDDVIIGCKLDPQVLHIVVPDEPTCIDHLTQAECEANDCYWWLSNNTCQDAPEGTTEYFDVHIKPYSFYDGKYEEAVSKTLTLTANLTGAIANYISGITGYEYKGIDILEDENKQIIVVRVYLSDTSIATLVAPIVIGAVAGIITGITLLLVGYVVGTSESEYTGEEVIELIDNASDEAIEACKNRYPNRLIDTNEAKAYADCVGGVDTTRVIAGADVSDEDPNEPIENIDNEIVNIGNGLDDGTINPEDIDAVVDEKITIPTREIVDFYKEKVVSEDCAWEIAGTCIITKKALKTLTIAGIGIGGLMALSAAKGITKK